jgi:uncharacterized protein (TIGR03435 family)
VIRRVVLTGLLRMAVIGTTVLPLSSQSSATKPSFEVASVKPSTQAGVSGVIRRTPGGRFTASNVGLRFLIQYAYRVHDSQIIGGPSWMATERWDIEAKAEEGHVAPPAGPIDPSSIDEINLRLQSLLEDRFQLKLHYERRELPLYIMTLAKDGPKMKAVDPPPPPDQAPPLPPPDRRPEGGLPSNSTPPPGTFSTPPGMFVGTAITMPQIIYVVSRLLGRAVTDKTDLKGTFDVRLQFAPESVPGNPVAAPAGASNPAGPSIFTAIQEQLGLRIESTKGPVDVLVIDSVQKPIEN